MAKITESDIVAGVYIFGNLFADVTVILMNPRLRRARTS